MEKYIEEKDVFEKIRKVIYKLCPVKQPRIEIDDNCYYKNVILEISFNFYQEEDFINTQICFLDNENKFQYYLVKDKVSEDAVVKLVAFLLDEFPYVNSVQMLSNGFEIEFGIGLEHFGQKGISCNKVKIEFSTHPKLKDKFGELFQNYLNCIISNFTIDMIRAPQVKEAYNNYRDSMKEKIINNLNLAELQQIILGLSEEKMRELLANMDIDSFL